MRAAEIEERDGAFSLVYLAGILVEKNCNREQHVHSCTCGHVFSSLTQELLAGSLKEEEYDSWRQAFPPFYRGGESTKEQVLQHFSGRNSSGMT